MKKTTGFILICILVLLQPNAYAVNASKSQASLEIKQDIQLLIESKSYNSEIALRLIDHGELILDQAHSVLLDKNSPAIQKRYLISILGRVESESSIEPILIAAKHHPGDILLTVIALNSLSRYKPTDEVIVFVDNVLASEQSDPKVLRGALSFYTTTLHSGAKKWAESYSEHQKDNNVRVQALYLGSLLSIDGFDKKIIGELKLRKNEKTLLIGLANLTTQDEFWALIRGMKLSNEDVRPATLLHLLKYGDREERKSAASEIIDKRYRMLVKKAVDYSIKNNDADVLVTSWLKKDKYIRSVVSKAGLSIDISEDNIKFVKATIPADEQSDNTELSIDDFSKAVFLSFKNNNKESFKTLALMSDDEFAKHLAFTTPYYRKQSLYFGKKATYESEVKQQNKIINEKVLNSWDAIYKKGLENNMDWALARYVGATYIGVGHQPPFSMMIGQNGRYSVIMFKENTLADGKRLLKGKMELSSKPLRDSSLDYWATIAENNNDSTAVSELKLLADSSHKGKISLLKMLISYNDKEAMYDLYGELIRGRVPEEREEAYRWLIKAAEGGRTKAQFEASQYLAKKYYEKNDASGLLNSRSFLEASAAKDYPQALREIAISYSLGHGGFEFDLDKAIHYNKLFSSLDAQSLTKDEYKYYMFVRYDVDDEKIKFTRWNEGIKANDSAILTEVAKLLLSSKFMKTRKVALELLHKAAVSEHVEAQYLLGIAYGDDKAGDLRDYKKAVVWLNKAAAKYHIKAKEKMFDAYYRGLFDLNVDLNKALVLAEELAFHYAKIKPENAPRYYTSDQIWGVQVENLKQDIKRKGS